MTRQQKNKVKALFLLLVFSLNTLAGFACSLGMNMGYNSHHHEHGKGQVRQSGTSHQQHVHKHQQPHHQYTTTKFTGSGSKDDCCSNDVAKFALLDKSVSDNSLNLQAPIFLLAFTSTFLSSLIKEPGVAVNSRFQFVRRSCFLNDTDLRIAIQSFQI
jgi:hypothetical protein